MNKPLFAHRPPSVGIHLLSDPLPDFIANSFPAASTPEVPAPTKRATAPAKARKTRTGS